MERQLREAYDFINKIIPSSPEISHRLLALYTLFIFLLLKHRIN
jgi:hypothetical protein